MYKKHEQGNIPNTYLCLSYLDAISSLAVFHKLTDLSFLDWEVNLRPTFKSNLKILWEFQIV